MDDLLKDFIIEATENISVLETSLLDLEKNPSDQDAIKIVFRAIHSIKGTCGMFGLHRLEKLTHAAEEVLVKIREGLIQIKPEHISILLNSLDIVKFIIATLELDGNEPSGDDEKIIHALESILLDKDTPSLQNTSQQQQTVTSNTSVQENNLRISISLLDNLMNTVGELVLIRNQLLQLVSKDDESIFVRPIAHLHRITSNLQESVMKTRMQPIGNAWNKIPRMIRDLEQSTGKKVDLILEGKDTEIDRQVLQAISDPLIHCIRNSIDHGIEASDVRLNCKKSSQGTIKMKAYHEGGKIIIEIQDDGKGIDPQIIKTKAIEKGLISSSSADELNDDQILQFIFEPGFSTAQVVTEISGRGVGMDVVKTNIESIGGTVEILSKVKFGTTIKIHIPLTLAIIQALLVRIGDHQGSNIFAIPQVSIAELVHINENTQHLLETIHDTKVLRLREKLLPILDLSLALGINHEKIGLSIVVIQMGDFFVGCLVDEVYDTQEIVVRPLGKMLREFNLFSGSTILGDGSVVIILDIPKIISQNLPTPSKEDKRNLLNQEIKDSILRNEIIYTFS